jgi:hypothetical protein
MGKTAGLAVTRCYRAIHTIAGATVATRPPAWHRKGWFQCPASVDAHARGSRPAEDHPLKRGPKQELDVEGAGLRPARLRRAGRVGVGVLRRSACPPAPSLHAGRGARHRRPRRGDPRPPRRIGRHRRSDRERWLARAASATARQPLAESTNDHQRRARREVRGDLRRPSIPWRCRRRCSPTSARKARAVRHGASRRCSTGPKTRSLLAENPLAKLKVGAATATRRPSRRPEGASRACTPRRRGQPRLRRLDLFGRTVGTRPGETDALALLRTSTPTARASRSCASSTRRRARSRPEAQAQLPDRGAAPTARMIVRARRARDGDDGYVFRNTRGDHWRRTPAPTTGARRCDAAGFRRRGRRSGSRTSPPTSPPATTAGTTSSTSAAVLRRGRHPAPARRPRRPGPQALRQARPPMMAIGQIAHAHRRGTVGLAGGTFYFGPS